MHINPVHFRYEVTAVWLWSPRSVTRYSDEFTPEDRKLMQEYAHKHGLTFDDAVEKAANEEMSRSLLGRVAGWFFSLLGSPGKGTGGNNGR
ncbi:MAG: hypothetical protein CSB48_02835 [Proteobacteria bacterium]|nr:MAG: hypothetical protein CSB48_02835 [Pseudomonadota bacterium]